MPTDKVKEFIKKSGAPKLTKAQVAIIKDHHEYHGDKKVKIIGALPGGGVFVRCISHQGHLDSVIDHFCYDRRRGGNKIYQEMAEQESGCRRTQKADKEGVFMMPTGKEGYSLKKWCLKQWIYSHGYTQPYVARRLGVSAEEFKRKLREHEKFNEYQISCLVELMKAKAAFQVLYFPTLEMRRRIYKEVFG